MGNASMTALICLFARAYHTSHNSTCIFTDSVAQKLISQEEYETISESMTKGIAFFNPSFRGNKEQALKWIVDNQLSPSPLGRSAFTLRSLENAVKIGAKQYLMLGAGYDTFAYSRPKWAEGLKVFEADLEATQKDKIKRIERAGIAISPLTSYIALGFNSDNWYKDIISYHGFAQSDNTICSILGVLYYLSNSSARSVFKNLSNLKKGSSIVFDYPDEFTFTEKAGERTKKQLALAHGADENMYCGYSYSQMESMLSEYGFMIYEHLTPAEITEQFFNKYNENNKGSKMSAFDNVNYCLAVKQ